MSFFDIDMTQVAEILPHVRQGSTFFYIVNIMATDDLAMQGVMIFT